MLRNAQNILIGQVYFSTTAMREAPEATASHLRDSVSSYPVKVFFNLLVGKLIMLQKEIAVHSRFCRILHNLIDDLFQQHRHTRNVIVSDFHIGFCLAESFPLFWIIAILLGMSYFFTHRVYADYLLGNKKWTGKPITVELIPVHSLPLIIYYEYTSELQ
jgi:hypothetical protein